MATIALSKSLQDKLGKQSDPTNLKAYRLRKLAQEQSRGEAKYFAEDSQPDQAELDPKLLTKLTPVIEYPGTPTARSAAFIKWLDADRNRCLILVQSGFGTGLAVVSDRRCLVLQQQQLSLF